MKVLLWLGFVWNTLHINSNSQILVQQQDLEEVTEKIYFDVTIGGVSKSERIVFGLFGNTVPLTVKNFATICTEGVNNNQYNFNGTIFHRVIRQFMIQGKICPSR